MKSAIIPLKKIEILRRRIILSTQIDLKGSKDIFIFKILFNITPKGLKIPQCLR